MSLASWARRRFPRFSREARTRATQGACIASWQHSRDPQSRGWKLVKRFPAPRRCCAMPRQLAAGFRCGCRRRDVSFPVRMMDASLREGRSASVVGTQTHHVIASWVPAFLLRPLDCFAEPVIRRRFAPTGWLAMTARGDGTPYARRMAAPGCTVWIRPRRCASLSSNRLKSR